MTTDKPTKAYSNALKTDILARTIWGEARGEGAQGMQAIACTIHNRLRIAQEHNNHFWWGNTIITICQKPYQFSCWNKSDPNFSKLTRVNARTNRAFASALKIAAQTLQSPPPDSTNGATHYHALGCTPKWAINQTPTATIGHHVFYRLV